MTRPVIQRDKLGVLAKIGQGGQGVVYRAPNVKTKFAASMVYKEYKPQSLADIDFTALAAMPALVEDSLTYAEAERLVSLAAWPCALVEDAGASTGFVMPAIPDEFFINLTTVKGVSKTSAEFQHLLNHPSVLAARGISIDDAQRYSLLREAASGLAFLHKHGVCVGDISPKNLLFSLTPHPAAYFIDCDAMRINGTSVQAQVETPGWQVPAGEELATIYTDAYKLGLLALRLLVGDHDTTSPAQLPASTPDLLRQIITDTLTKPPLSRPLPEAWNYVLGNAIEIAQHEQKAVVAKSVSVAPQAPPTPVLYARPPSGPQTRPSPPPPPQAPFLPPPVGPRLAPPARAESSSKAPLLVGVGVGIVGIIALIVSAVALSSGNRSAPTSSNASGSTSTAASNYPSADSTASSTSPTTTTSTWSPPSDAAPPPLVQGADTYGDTCSDGIHFTDRTGWATHSGRGTETTSCQFAENVLKAYWANSSTPGPDSRQVVAASRIACPQVAAGAPMHVECSGDAFVMTCAVNGADTWITCTGGNDAKVYIY